MTPHTAPDAIIVKGEGVFRAAVASSRNMLIPYYLMAAYSYYHRDSPFLSDGTFDQMCKDLDAEWDDLTHRHKDVIRRDDLKAGSCSLPRHEFPLLTKSAACRLSEVSWERADDPVPVLSPVRVRVRTRPALQPAASI